MSLRFKYIVYIILLHLVLISLVYFSLKDKLWYFLASEILVMISLYFSYVLYKSFIKPLNLIHSGTDAIADKDFSIKYLKTGSTEVDHLVDVYNRMIETLRKERTLISEQSYFIQKIIEVTPIGIIIMDYDGLISNANLAAKKQLDIPTYTNPVGKKISEFPSELMDALIHKETGQAEIVRINDQDKYKVQLSEVIHRGFKRKFILIDDLSVELLKTEKEAYGTIIRMMAHEVNNSMGAINSILDSVVEFGFQNEGDQDLKDSLLIAKKRNTGLAKFMDNYASLLRLPYPVKKNIDLVQLLRKTGELFISNAQQNNINLSFQLANKEITIHADSLLLEQAISNMIKNAIEAIGTNGEIRISCDDNPIHFLITDNGEGISDEVSEQLFKPFFSTKTTGQGVGLMLIRDVLQSHQATYKLSTDQNTGWTNFYVQF